MQYTQFSNYGWRVGLLRYTKVVTYVLDVLIKQQGRSLASNNFSESMVDYKYIFDLRLTDRSVKCYDS